MNIQEMIINCNLLFSKINSNQVEGIYTYEWEDILNLTIQEYVREKTLPLNKAYDTLISSEEGLSSLIREYTFTTFLDDTVGKKKIANLNVLNINSGEQYISKPSITPITTGKKYQIITLNSTDDFKPLGAVTNTVGEIFSFYKLVEPTTSTGYVISSSGDGTVLEFNMSNYIDQNSKLHSGVVYKVIRGSVLFNQDYDKALRINGVDYYLTDIGDNAQNHSTNITISTGDSFTIIESYDIDWTYSSILKELNSGDAFFKYINATANLTYPNCNTSSIIKPVIRIENTLNTLYKSYSKGAINNNPICYLENNNLILPYTLGKSNVTANKQYDITSVILKYYKEPNRVSLVNNISCDLDLIVHSTIVRNAVETVGAAVRSGNWETLRQDNLKVNNKTT